MCERRVTRKDPYAVAVTRRQAVVGHVPRKVSAACALFLRKGSIGCVITGGRRFSADLPQGGLEVPCTLLFRGEPKDIAKMRKLIPVTSTKSPTRSTDDENEPPKKMRKISPETVDVDKAVVTNFHLPQRWLSLKGNELTMIVRIVTASQGARTVYK